MPCGSAHFRRSDAQDSTIKRPTPGQRAHISARPFDWSSLQTPRQRMTKRARSRTAWDLWHLVRPRLLGTWCVRQGSVLCWVLTCDSPCPCPTSNCVSLCRATPPALGRLDLRPTRPCWACRVAGAAFPQPKCHCTKRASPAGWRLRNARTPFPTSGPDTHGNTYRSSTTNH